jgi:hypothetical protein
VDRVTPEPTPPYSSSRLTYKVDPKPSAPLHCHLSPGPGFQYLPPTWWQCLAWLVAHPNLSHLPSAQQKRDMRACREAVAPSWVPQTLTIAQAPSLLWKAMCALFPPQHRLGTGSCLCPQDSIQLPPTGHLS